MESHKFNMYAGAAIGSLLVFLLLNFFTDLIYIGRGHSEHEPLAFAVAVEDTGQSTETPKEIDYAALLAQADPAKGEKLFGKCKSCHKLEEGANSVGPSLYRVVGRAVATAEGYSYSDAMKAHGGNWDLKSLSAFLTAPKAAVPGTKMGFAGLPKPQDRVNLITYLNQAGGAPIELTAPETAKADTGDTQSDAANDTSAEPTASEESKPEETETAAATGSEQSSDNAAASTDAATTNAAASAGGGKYAELLAAADPKAGEKVFRKCKACHTLEEGKNRVGPSLYGVVGRDIGSVKDFNYSDAMSSYPGHWTLSELDAYLANPKKHVPGNKMSFGGIKDEQDRINVITYINEADGSPEKLGQ